MQFREFDVQRVHTQDLQRQAHQFNKGHLLVAAKPTRRPVRSALMMRVQSMLNSLAWTRASTTCEPV